MAVTWRCLTQTEEIVMTQRKTLWCRASWPCCPFPQLSCLDMNFNGEFSCLRPLARTDMDEGKHMNPEADRPIKRNFCINYGDSLNHLEWQCQALQNATSIFFSMFFLPRFRRRFGIRETLSHLAPQSSSLTQNDLNAAMIKRFLGLPVHDGCLASLPSEGRRWSSGDQKSQATAATV